MPDDGGRIRELLQKIQAEAEQAERDRAESMGMTVDEMREADAAKERAEREEERRRHEAFVRRRWIERFSRTIPADAAAVIYDRQELDTEPVRCVKAFLASPQPCLILCGGVGSGKTFASILARRERPDGLFLKAAELPRAVDPWKHEREDGWQPLDLELPFLAVDDLGAEMDEPRFHQALFAVVDARQSSDTKTLITTNLRREEIRPRYGDRIADRLNDMAKAVQLKGASMRKQGAGL